MLVSADNNILYSKSVNKNGQYGGFYRGVYNSQPHPYISWETSPYSVFSSDPNQSTWRLATSQSNPDYIYVSWIGKHDGTQPQIVYKSIQGGAPNSWVNVGSPSQNGWITSIAVDYNDPDHIWGSVGGDVTQKVYDIHTNQAPYNWQDITYDLPSDDMSLLCLQPVKGVVTGLYAATSLGIYYTDNSLITGSSSKWINVTGNLPNVEIDDIQINYHNGTIVAGTFGRGVWVADLPCSDNTLTEHISNPDVVWNNYKRVLHDVIIDPGAKLTVYSEISFGKDNKIVVKPGGKLVIDGGTLTNACNGLWIGVEVWGNKDQSQFTINGTCAQGRVDIKNGGTIQNAKDAIRLWNASANDFNSTGGIVYADNANFINNRRAIEFMSYHNHLPNSLPAGNLSRFSKCSFSTDDNYLGPDKFYAFISMWDVEGINISGCTFKNESAETYSTLRGIGIHTIDAGYNVQTYCDPNIVPPCPPGLLIPSTFQGLGWGIKAENGGQSTNSFTVDGAIFTDNSYGVQVLGVNNCKIIRSNFYIGSNTDCPAFTGIGIELNNATDYTIEENTFAPSESVPPEPYFIGIRVFYYPDASFVPNNIIYKNTATDINVGNQAEGKNTDDVNGLFYFCNENQNNIYDFYVTGHGIQQNQKDQDHSAGNKFSKMTNPNIPYSDFNNQGDVTIDYYYYCQAPPPYTCSQNPEMINDKVKPKYWSNENDCLSHFTNGGGAITKLSQSEITAYEQEFADNSVAFNNVLAVYQALRDGGNTEGLELDIISSTPGQTMQLRDELLGISPHLSEEILREAADRYDVFPNNILFDILSANPDELRNEELLRYLQEKPDPLPNYMIELLREIANDTTYKTTLLRQLSHYSVKRSQAAYAIIRDLVFDTIPQPDSLRAWLDNMQELASDYQIIDSWLQEKNTTAAMALVDLLPQMYPMDSAAMAEYDSYKEVKTILAGLINDNRNIFQLDSAEIDLLDNIANTSKGLSGTEARNILTFGYGYMFIDCADIITAYKDKKINEPSAIYKIFEPGISVSPNPANEWTAFNYTLRSGINNSYIKITNMNGQTIILIPVNRSKGQVIWDTRNMIPGVYCFTLINDKYSKSGKITVIH